LKYGGEDIAHGKMEADNRKTITQGIGICETANFAKAKVAGAIVGENRETIEMLIICLKTKVLASLSLSSPPSPSLTNVRQVYCGKQCRH
jgi:hypothetical protein